MREKAFRRRGLWLVLTVLVVGLMAVAAYAQMTTAEEQAAVAGMSTATVTLTDNGIVIDPARPGPGPVRYTIINNTDRPRGLVITGEDRANTPIIRYSNLISPGGSGNVEFWMYLGKSYTFHDYSSRRVVGNQTRFTSRYSTTITYPAPAGLGRGPSFEREQVAVSLTDNGIQMGTIQGAPTTFVVTNNSSRSRGLVINGEDRAGSPIIRYTRLLRPGQTAVVNFWLYGNRPYTIKDYTHRTVSGGQVAFTSTYSESFTTPAIPLPPRFGAGPSTRTESDIRNMPDQSTE